MGSDLTVMRPRRFNTLLAFWPIVLTGMVGLLATVAVLQYRWTNEASSADEMRIGAELESLVMKWHGDLFSEFSAICIAMQVGPDAGARDTWNDYLDRYVQWNNALPHESLPYVYRNPDLVGEIYIWETTQQSKPRLFWLSLDEKRIEPYVVPKEFVTLLARLQANSSSLSTALHAWQLPGRAADSAFAADNPPAAIATGSSPISGWQFDPTIPAMVHPIFHHGAEKSLNSGSPVDWIIITLDMSVLQKRILPELSARYFGGLSGLDYKVALVTTGSTPRTLYSSDPRFGIRQLGTADSTLNIFGFPPEALPGNSQRGGRTSRSLRSSEWRSLTAPVWFPVMEYGAKPDSWLLEVQHRSGPLQAVVNGVRRNNLAISAMVLLLLAVNIAVLTFAGYRAQSFAKLQMDFVASISHELRTPLAVIFSAGENIKDGVIRKASDLAEYGSIVTAQSRQLMNHVDRILLFASIRSGKDRYTLRPLLVCDILGCVHKNMGPLVAEESCMLEEFVEPGLPPVLGDMFAVCGCLENLITNAVKYGRADRRIQISAMLSKTQDGKREVAISVEDHGIGIDKSEFKHIFEPFYRSPVAAAAQIHGTGLGLSLAKHLAEAVGGSLSVTSEVGSGSIFTLHLRLAEDAGHERPSNSLQSVASEEHEREHSVS
jgi:two-component system sensor histidine kinase SenX3